MSKKQSPRRKQSATNDEPESIRMAVMAWLMTTLTTLVCMAIVAATRGYVLWVDPDAAKIALLSGLLLFASLVLGVLALGLQFVVLRIRRPAPPRPVLFSATIIALLPILAALIVILRS